MVGTGGTTALGGSTSTGGSSAVGGGAGKGASGNAGTSGSGGTFGSSSTFGSGGTFGSSGTFGGGGKVGSGGMPSGGSSAVFGGGGRGGSMSFGGRSSGAGSSAGGRVSASGAGGSSAGGAGSSVAFSQVAAIIQTNCGASNCHGGRQGPTLTSSNLTTLYNTLTSTTVRQCGSDHLVTKNDTANSALLELPQGTCSNFIMPQGCTKTPCLAAADITTITNWINAGAPGP